MARVLPGELFAAAEIEEFKRSLGACAGRDVAAAEALRSAGLEATWG